MDLVIKNGLVATSNSIFRGDIGVQGGKIAALGSDLEGDQTIDVDGKYVLPGQIDVHTHFDLSWGGTDPSKALTMADDWLSGTKAAAFGGVTTVVDYVMPNRGQDFEEAVSAWHHKAEGKALIDYGFHITVPDAEQERLEGLPEWVRRGYASFKIFMAYQSAVGLNDYQMYGVMDQMEKARGLTLVHAENDGAINYLTDKYVSQGKTDVKYHYISRPPDLEAEAAHRAIVFARLTGSPLYFVHISTRGAMEHIMEARANGLPVYAETCPQYLTLTEDVHEEPDFQGAKYVCTPPIRSEANRKAMWQGLRDGHISTVCSDHSNRCFHDKELGRHNFAEIPHGIGGVELLGPLLFSQGVKEGIIDIHKFVQVTSTNAARLFGLFPQKGTIAIGSDADLVVYDPNLERTITKSLLHDASDYSCYEGLRATGWPVMTISRGEVVVENRELRGQQGRGQFVRRQSFSRL